MTLQANTSASTSTSSGASSSTPAPPSHGIRSQLGHLLPRHALFQVHLHIDQLSNVPLIKGEFGIRWKFKNVQSGSGLLSKMRGHRTWSGQGKRKGAGESSSGTPSAGAEEADLHEEDEVDEVESVSVHESTHDTTEDGHYASASDSPQSPRDSVGHRGALDLLHPPAAPTPIINGPSRSSVSLQSSRSEARGITPWAPLRNFNVKWDHSINVVVQMDVHRETCDLLPNELKLVVMQRVIPGDPDSPQHPRLGAVYLNLAEYADAGKVTRRYLLRQSKTNATLKLTVELEHVGGEKHYKPPPLRKGEILASVSGILSNNGLFNTRFARELDLYVGADKPYENDAFPYADNQGHVQPERLTNSYGLRTTEHLIEALFNPVPSQSVDQTPFTYYAPPQPNRSVSRQASDAPADAGDIHDRRSIDSSIGSASYVATASEHSSVDHGVVAESVGVASHRHWWQKMRSRPNTPSARTTLRPATTISPVPVRPG